jgi:hypothetical protein
MDLCTWTLLDELVCLPLIVGGTTLADYETLYVLLREQECRFTTPSQGAGLVVLSMGDGILTHLSFRFPDPTIVMFICLPQI